MVTLAPTASIMVYTSDGKSLLLCVSIRLPAQVPTCTGEGQRREGQRREGQTRTDTS